MDGETFRKLIADLQAMLAEEQSPEEQADLIEALAVLDNAEAISRRANLN
jgi:hypothetical protein